MRRGIALLAGCALALLPPPRAAGADGTEAALAAVNDRTDVVLIEDPPPIRPMVMAATLVRAAPAAVRAVVSSPRSFGIALPSLIRTDVIATRTGEAGLEQRVAWELEVPLFNLEGKMWVRLRPDGAEMSLDQGDFAPGHFVFQVRPAGDGKTLLTLRGRANVRGASWVIRRLVAKTALAEPAITALTALVLVRATAALAEQPGNPAARRPPPPGQTSQPAGVEDPGPALATQPPSGAVIATVERTPSGGLASAAVAIELPLSAPAAAATLALPSAWSAFPGWSVKPLGPASAAVDVSIPFTDLDATWEVRSRDPLRVVAVDGGVRGAAFTWRFRSEDGERCRAALALQPRLHAAGWMIRKFLTAEPLLESGLALALAYGDAIGTRMKFSSARQNSGQ